MYLKWAKTEEEKKTFVGQALAAQPFIKKLINILEKDYDALEEQRVSREQYDKSSWPFYQADKIGEQRAYKKIIKLLNNILSEENKND